MPRKFQLTWQPGSANRGGRWRKKYKGNTYYFDGGRGKFDREAYDTALAAWNELRIKIDASTPRPHQVDYDQAIAKWEQVLSWSNRHGEQQMASRAYEKLAKLRTLLDAPTLSPLPRADRFESFFELPVIKLPADFHERTAADLATGEVTFRSLPQVTPEFVQEWKKFDGSEEQTQRAVWEDRLQMQQRRSVLHDNTVAAYAEEYIKQKSQKVESDELTVGRAYEIRLHLTYFQEWIGKDTGVDEIDSNTLLKYQSHLLDNRQVKDWSRTTAQHYLKTVKAFVRWLWRTEAIDSLPRILDDRSGLLNITPATPQIVVYSIEEIQQLVQAATDRTRLYILLMLNCGMTQKDVSDLRGDEVDWEQGRIIRKRSKTADHQTVPRVSYLLWAETFRLLEQERNREDATFVLTNHNGSPLCTEGFGANQQLKKTDNVKNSFDRLRKKLGITKSLKSLKKTSATLLRSDERFQGLEGLFLGHAPQSMSDKHYTQIPGKLLDQAILWLEAHYRIEESLSADHRDDENC